MNDNREHILPLLSFPSEDTFYFCQIIKRKKDNLDSQYRDSIVIKTYYLTEKNNIEKNWLEMTYIANALNARVMINLNPRSFKRCAFRVAGNIIFQLTKYG